MTTMNETKRIIVEFGARRQQLILADRLILISKLLQLIGNRFDISLENHSPYLLQIYDSKSNEYHSLDDFKRVFDLTKDFEELQRFRIIRKSLITQKHQLLNNLHSTVGKLSHATQDIDQIQNLVGTLNQNCDKLNQLMDIRYSNSSIDQSSSSFSYIFDPAIMKKNIDVMKESLDNDYDDDENFESVSCFDNTPIYPEHPPPPIPTVITLTDNNIQTRIIPCKFAVRGTCRLGDKCPYLHDETCIQSAREWERRL